MGIVNCVTPSMVDCQIYKQIYQTAQSTQANFLFLRCTFTGDGEHHLAGTISGTIVIGSWIGNYAAYKNPIIIDLTRIYDQDMSHSYKYENNIGKFLSKYPKKTWIDMSWLTPGAAWGYEQSLSNANPFKVILCSNGGPWDAIGDPIGMGVHGLEMDMPFFSIGTCTCVFKLSVSFEGNMKYGDRAFTQSYAFVGECIDTIYTPTQYKCTSFNDKLIGQPVRLPGWVNNSDWPTKCVATFERVR